MPLEFAPPIEQGLQPFNVPGPQYTDPLQTIGEMNQLKQQAMQTQQMQMDLQSQQGFMRAYMDANGDPEQAIKLAPSYGVLPKDIFSAQQLMLKAQQDKANLTKTDLENHNTYLDQVHAAFQPMFDEKDPPTQAAMAASIQQDLLNKGTIKQPVFHYTDPESARLFEATLNTEKYTTARATQQQAKTAADRLKAEEPGLAATAEERDRSNAASLLSNATDPASYDAIRDKFIASGDKNSGRNMVFPSSRQVFDQNGQWIPGRQALISRTGVPVEKRPEYDIKAAEAEAMKNLTPDSIGEMVRGSIDPAAHPAEYARTHNDAMNALKLGLGVTGVNAAIKDGSDRVAALEQQMNPDLAAFKQKQAVDQAAAEERVKAPLEVAKAISVEKAKAAMSPDVFNQIIDPSARLHAMNDTLKYTKEYTDKQNDAQRLLDTIAAAQKGNQAASGLIPLEEVRAIVNRVNRQELEAVGGNQGSLFRRVDNWLSKATTGVASADQLKDLRALANLSNAAARRAYDGARRGTQAIYGITPPDVDAIPAPSAAPRAGGVPPVPNTIPQQFRSTAHYSPSQRRFYYSTDGGKTWIPAPLQ